MKTAVCAFFVCLVTPHWTAQTTILFEVVDGVNSCEQHVTRSSPGLYLLYPLGAASIFESCVRLYVCMYDKVEPLFSPQYRSGRPQVRKVQKFRLRFLRKIRKFRLETQLNPGPSSKKHPNKKRSTLERVRKIRSGRWSPVPTPTPWWVYFWWLMGRIQT